MSGPSTHARAPANASDTCNACWLQWWHDHKGSNLSRMPRQSRLTLRSTRLSTSLRAPTRACAARAGDRPPQSVGPDHPPSVPWHASLQSVCELPPQQQLLAPVKRGRALAVQRLRPLRVPKHRGVPAEAAQLGAPHPQRRPQIARAGRRRAARPAPAPLAAARPPREGPQLAEGAREEEGHAQLRERQRELEVSERRAHQRRAPQALQRRARRGLDSARLAAERLRLPVPSRCRLQDSGMVRGRLMPPRRWPFCRDPGDVRQGGLYECSWASSGTARSSTFHASHGRA
mmetsp:Transcript_11052/g.22864  ORF Transcript_11052/g.22864 Transcript_11052/m.22864 type:complete len:289 (+) Transcript_11052:102-968(+)